MAIQWQNQVCLITGASGGIGEAIARKLAGLGASLILTGRNADKLTALLESLPGRHTIACADITTQEGLDKVVAVCHERQPTMLVNSAGISEIGDFKNMPMARIETLLATNLTAPIALTQRLLPILQRAGKGYVVNVGSTFGSIGFPCHAAYCASKFALRGFTESLIREYANSPVNFYYLAPRATKTAINSDAVVSMNQALGNQMDSPELVADALVAQLEANKSRWFIGFPEKLFARINGVLPEIVDRALIKKLPTIKRFLTSVTKEKLS
ncbi:SDR family oxidoreductase [Alteromonas lipolytica]|uniref:Short chain dehydrogenase n=1 Tax=Alteromonas lipolytica TaxID=1856405 RepID=A0A1E8FAT7_9ALTE|nr:SDR family oxidoreductase [Alteromonas lipolytica]OFI33025.1 short chain dehydrogenase [Alteromonas lipolytica]GGF63185.1 short chain dehydrogenase [Alteromonas lipolytica]